MIQLYIHAFIYSKITTKLKLLNLHDFENGFTLMGFDKKETFLFVPTLGQCCMVNHYKNTSSKHEVHVHIIMYLEPFCC